MANSIKRQIDVFKHTERYKITVTQIQNLAFWKWSQAYHTDMSQWGTQQTQAHLAEFCCLSPPSSRIFFAVVGLRGLLTAS